MNVRLASFLPLPKFIQLMGTRYKATTDLFKSSSRKLLVEEVNRISITKISERKGQQARLQISAHTTSQYEFPNQDQGYYK